MYHLFYSSNKHEYMIMFMAFIVVYLPLSFAIVVDLKLNI